MLRGIYGDPERFVKQYWSQWTDGSYFTGDGARLDDDGFYWLLGRVDDVLNVAGHRLGTMEVESALVDHPRVAEAAVVGKPHEIKGQAVAAFVTLKEGQTPSDALAAELKEHVVKKIGAIARPDQILFTADLPKTRSGKIMRRLLRDIAEGKALGDTTTLADPTRRREAEDEVPKTRKGKSRLASRRYRTVFRYASIRSRSMWKWRPRRVALRVPSRISWATSRGVCAEHRRGAEDRQRRRQQRDALDPVAAVQFGAKHGGLGLRQDVGRIELRLHEIGPDGGGADGHDLRHVGLVVLQDKPMLHRFAEPRGQQGRLIDGRFREEHGDRVVAVARDPVVRAEEAPREDAGALEEPVADAPAVLAVDLRQIVDVEEQQRERVLVPDGALDFLRQRELENRRRDERRQRDRAR